MRYSIRAEAGKALELDILDVISDDFFFGGVSARSVVNQLKGFQGDTIKVRLNSRGGEVTEGFAIYQLLQQHKANVEVEVLGLAASIASVIAMAGDKITIGEGGFVMIHNPSGVMRGESDDFRHIADLLDSMQTVIADVYVARTGQPKDDVLQWMNAETWMSAKQALERGFVDNIVPAKTKPKKSGAKAFAMFNEAELEGAPEELLAAIRAAHEPEPEPEPEPETPPTQDQPAPEEGGDSNKETAMKLINLTKLLALSEDADEAAICAAVTKLKTSAHVGAEVEKLLGVTGHGVIGAVKALKETNESNEELGNEVAKLKIVNARRDFENARDQGLKDKKLVPATAKFETDRFEAALNDATLDVDARAEAASRVAAELQGRLKIAPRIVNTQGFNPAPPAAGGDVEQTITHNGKVFEAMKANEWVALKRDNPDLYDTMRADAVQRGVI